MSEIGLGSSLSPPPPAPRTKRASSANLSHRGTGRRNSIKLEKRSSAVGLLLESPQRRVVKEPKEPNIPRRKELMHIIDARGQLAATGNKAKGFGVMTGICLPSNFPADFFLLSSFFFFEPFLLTGFFCSYFFPADWTFFLLLEYSFLERFLLAVPFLTIASC
jgi:hypothetical protein